MSRDWRFEDHDDYGVLTLDMAGQSANVVSEAMLGELDTLLDELAGRSLPGLILRSGKDNGFIFGADVTQFGAIKEAGQAAALARRGQAVFDKLAALAFPTVAVIHGNCLGGGLELALACDYRVALDDAGTRLGLPEVRLGIHPGFGGTVRLPKRVGVVTALDMMLTGRSLSAKAARRVGLVDEVVPERHLLHAAQFLLNKRPRRRLAWRQRMAGVWPASAAVKRLLTRRVAAKANPDHYPAPFRILELWRQHAGQQREAESLGELLVGRTSRNLVHVFELAEALKRHGREIEHAIGHVHVIGAGVMGGDIAAWAAYKGFRVSLQDRQADILAGAMQRAYKLFRNKLKDEREIQAALDRLMPDLNGDGLASADLVVEAIVENAEIKRKVFADIERRAPRHAVLASNTSSIPLEVIGEPLSDPGRLVGLHFFNPVAKMQLVEIVHGRDSGEPSLARARAFTVALGRLPLDVKSSPGFLVNRILMPYLMEAMAMVEEGVPLREIDRAAVDFGMPMGPIELADVVGLDICLSVAEELAEPLGVVVPQRLREMVERGHLGKKSGRGFYKYDRRGRPNRPRSRGRSDSVPITERLILRLLNEAMACLREGVVDNKDAVDAGMVYGTGFAPYLGGPMRYAESMGETGISHSLYRLAEVYGQRFNPDAGWTQPELLSPQRN